MHNVALPEVENSKIKLSNRRITGRKRFLVGCVGSGSAAGRSKRSSSRGERKFSKKLDLCTFYSLYVKISRILLLSTANVALKVRSPNYKHETKNIGTTRVKMLHLRV